MTKFYRDEVVFSVCIGMLNWLVSATSSLYLNLVYEGDSESCKEAYVS